MTYVNIGCIQSVVPAYMDPPSSPCIYGPTELVLHPSLSADLHVTTVATVDDNTLNTFGDLDKCLHSYTQDTIQAHRSFDDNCPKCGVE